MICGVFFMTRMVTNRKAHIRWNFDHVTVKWSILIGWNWLKLVLSIKTSFRIIYSTGIWIFKSTRERKCLKECRLGFPPEFRVTVYVRKWSGNFFHFHDGKGSGKPEFRNNFRNDCFSIKRKFPELCSGITDRYGIPERSRISFRNNWYHNYIKVLHM